MLFVIHTGSKKAPTIDEFHITLICNVGIFYPFNQIKQPLNKGKLLSWPAESNKTVNRERETHYSQP
jgi:hypothetical protein